MTVEASSAAQAWRARKCLRAQRRPVRGTVYARALDYKEHSWDVVSDDAEAAERVLTNEAARTTFEVHALYSADVVGFKIGDDGADRLCAWFVVSEV